MLSSSSTVCGPHDQFIVVWGVILSSTLYLLWWSCVICCTLSVSTWYLRGKFSRYWEYFHSRSDQSDSVNRPKWLILASVSCPIEHRGTFPYLSSVGDTLDCWERDCYWYWYWYDGYIYDLLFFVRADWHPGQTEWVWCTSTCLIHRWHDMRIDDGALGPTEMTDLVPTGTWHYENSESHSVPTV